jgi:hypothetical protein
MFVTCFRRIDLARSHSKSTGLGHAAGGVAATELKKPRKQPHTKWNG